MASSVIEISTKWQKEPTECEICLCCQDVIYSDANRLIIVICEKESKTDVVICNSCFDGL